MQIAIRELKANPCKAIARAQQGQRVQITSHRKVVAELVMPQADAASALRSDDEQALARLLASGWVSQPATQPLTLPKAVRFAPAPDGKTLSDLVIEGRGPG